MNLHFRAWMHEWIAMVTTCNNVKKDVAKVGEWFTPFGLSFKSGAMRSSQSAGVFQASPINSFATNTTGARKPSGSKTLKITYIISCFLVLIFLCSRDFFYAVETVADHIRNNEGQVAPRRDGNKRWSRRKKGAPILGSGWIVEFKNTFSLHS